MGQTNFENVYDETTGKNNYSNELYVGSLIEDGLAETELGLKPNDIIKAKENYSLINHISNYLSQKQTKVSELHRFKIPRQQNLKKLLSESKSEQNILCKTFLTPFLENKEYQTLSEAFEQGHFRSIGSQDTHNVVNTNDNINNNSNNNNNSTTNKNNNKNSTNSKNSKEEEKTNSNLIRGVDEDSTFREIKDKLFTKYKINPNISLKEKNLLNSITNLKRKRIGIKSVNNCYRNQFDSFKSLQTNKNLFEQLNLKQYKELIKQFLKSELQLEQTNFKKQLMPKVHTVELAKYKKDVKDKKENNGTSKFIVNSISDLNKVPRNELIQDFNV